MEESPLAKEKTKSRPAKRAAIDIRKLDPIKLDAELCRRSFYHFYKQIFPLLENGVDFQDNFHIRYICDRLQKVAEDVAAKKRRKHHLICNVPVRSSKSLLASICFPAWIWCKYPHLHFANYSYSDRLVNTFASKCRDIITSQWYTDRFDVELKKDRNSLDLFANTKRGERFASTVGGQSTGFGADITVIDDPISPRMARSETELRNVQEWYSQTLSTRNRNPATSVRIIVMQRLHENDLTGYLLDKDPNGFEHICIPAELTRDLKPPELIVHYDENGLYWPERFSQEFLEGEKKPGTGLGANGYAGQYLQKPVPSEGGLFRYHWFNRISFSDFLSANKNVVWNCYVDSAETDKKHNDATAVLIGCQLNNNFYVKESVAVRKEPFELEQWLISYLPQFLSSNSRVYIEGKSSGKGLISNLKAKTKFNIIEHQPGRDSKFVRASNIQSAVEAGRVFLIEGSYVEDLLEELSSFPYSKHDDRVDTLVMLVSKKTAGKSSYFFSK